ncbi:50S ribosomal protein L14e [Thermocladium modestius]|uniref:Large ribosomal subunit protein eL14 n=1 Tax=Thermocladium modestius TaxID=62609 RepID=A0A830GVB1_9CREN|nr:50S ribosomal protein L14e [Thermocladium modestius]GGP19940.1 50S ribosomal protein L14e [Thermocladium modestius]GGP21360.1 50S ribosomal protein L14e [Thermocladium modestius]
MARVFDVGRICVKTRGREAGRMCVVVDVIDDDFLLITGPRRLTGVKRRKVNAKHVEPTQHRINIGKGASDEEVIKAIEEAKLTETVRQGVKPNLYLTPTLQ